LTLNGGLGVQNLGRGKVKIEAREKKQIARDQSQPQNHKSVLEKHSE
jgi:hypothetical protein